MKNFILCMTILLFVSSCTNDEIPLNRNPESGLSTSTTNDPPSERLGDIYPVNSNNPYDYVGTLHNEILSTYYQGSNLPTEVPAIAARVTATANLNSGYIQLNEPFTRGVQLERVNYILSHPNTCIADIIDGSKMSPTGKASLKAFMITAVILMQDGIEYGTLYDFVYDYENGIIADGALTFQDKRTILITASITRHTVHMRKKRPKKNTDPDWTVLIANIVGGTYGADYESKEAIATGLTAGIAQNR